LRVVIASPGDVKAERELIPRVVEEVNRNIARPRGLHLDVYRWETDSYPGFHPQGPQGLIDPLLKIEDCDLLIGIFWRRFGTPVSDAKSGTEHEFRLAYNGWKKNSNPQIMVYFSQRPYTPKSKEETDQWGLLLQFKKEFPREGLWWDYKSKSEFETLLRNHLTIFLKELLGDYRRAIMYDEQNLAVTSEIGDRRGEGEALSNIGVAYKNLGDYRRAIEYYEQHLAIAREIGDRKDEGHALGKLGIAYDSLGDYRRAIEYYEQMLAITREVGDRRGEGYALGNLGNAYGSLGEYRRAIEPVGEVAYSKGSTANLSKSLRVFLCHSAADKTEVRGLYRRLKENGFAPWLDEENLIGGQDWQYEIKKAVRQSGAVVVCLSQNSISKAGFIQKEIKYALDVADEQTEGMIFIIPLRLETCEVPERLARFQWIDYFKDGGYERLVVALQTRAKSSSPSVDGNATRITKARIQASPTTLALEVSGEVHNYDSSDTPYFFIRASGFVRHIRFDPIESRHGLKIWIDGISSLAPAERVPLTFRAGEDGEYNGVAGHLVNFFEGGSSSVDQPPYHIAVHFFDGINERTEQYIIAGHPLPKGGVRLEVFPTLDEKQKRKKAREAVGKVLEQLAQCERQAYDGSNAVEYSSLLRGIEQIKRTVREIAIRYLDSSFESRFLAVNVHDVQLDEPTRMHFISRAQGSFWTVYQQVKGWRACLVDILRELNRE
jgi:tetratricopeptide (TPR) repeat protein